MIIGLKPNLRIRANIMYPRECKSFSPKGDEMAHISGDRTQKTQHPEEQVYQSLVDQLAEQDIHISFSTSVERSLRTVAQDPKVLAIKMTLYRASAEGKVIESLIEAARNGKQVAVLVEARARRRLA